ncbi:cystathionine beta-synthase, partial [Ascosphaera atra]
YLVGGSSGSALACLVKAAGDLSLTEDDVVVVICPDSIRSYLSKFADDDWMAANGFPINKTAKDVSTKKEPSTPATPEPVAPISDDTFSGATVRALGLKSVTTVTTTTPCSAAIDIMHEKSYDQLPVLEATNGNSLVGLVTLGNILSRLTHGRASRESPVKDVMFNFTKMSEVITDIRELKDVESAKDQKKKHKKFIEITYDTPLSFLNRFFEWNSAAVITEKDDKGVMKPVAVATKVDLLTWLVKEKKL